MQEDWKPIDRYAMRSEPWTVCKVFLDGCSLYLVWKDGINRPLAHLNSFEDCKEWIDGKGSTQEMPGL